MLPLRALSHLAVPALLALGVGLNLQLRSLDVPFIAPPDVQTARWSPKLFETVSFGQLPAAIDWLWIKSMTDPAMDRVQPGIHPPLYYHLDLATDLDPANFEAYFAGANLLVVVRDDKTGARDLLLKGERFLQQELPAYPQTFKDRFWSSGWQIEMLLGYVWLFELDNMKEAAGAFQRAAKLPNAPQFLLRLDERLEKPDGQYEVGLRLLNFMLTTPTAADPRVRQSLERKRESLFLSQYLHTLTLSFKDFLAKNPAYRARHQLSSEEMRRYWSTFKREANVPDRDPWGGEITIDANGKVDSTTPRIKVFGLD